MKRFSILAYGTVCYAIFFATFLYAIGFLADAVVPKTIDSGPAGPIGVALAVNLGLLSLFAVQHSVMARPGFKRWWTRIVPPPAERSTYVLASSIAMIALFAFWQPLPGTVYRVEGAIGQSVLTGLFACGVMLVLYSTFLIDHFDLFGLRQVVLHFRGRAYEEKRFQTPSLYRHIRHPLYVGWFVTFWATPHITWGHLLFAAVASAYILVAIVFEERDLATALGSDYREWRARTPKFLPALRRRPATEQPVRPVSA